MAARSCCSMVMYSAVFCSVVALLICGSTGRAQVSEAPPAPGDPLRHWARRRRELGVQRALGLGLG